MYKIEDITNTVICGNTLTELKKFPNESIDCVITSPPYWALRDYGIEPSIWDGEEGCEHRWRELEKTLSHKSGETNPGKEGWFKDKGASDDKGSCFCIICNAWRGSLGLEPTFELYIKHLLDIFDEIKRVLKKSGTCWVNLGDTYGGSGGSAGHTPESKNLGRKTFEYGAYPSMAISPKDMGKCLLQIPSRFSIEMCNRGWILRNEIIWFKRNCMPSSVKDRFTVDFEKIFFFVKDKRYWFERQFEANKSKGLKWGRFTNPKYNALSGGSAKGRDGMTREEYAERYKNRNKRCVWDIPTKPFKESHFAVFPEQLVETPIKAGSPEFVCNKCGKAREKVYKDERVNTRPGINTGNAKSGKKDDPNKSLHNADLSKYRQQIIYKSKGYASCSCNAGFSGGIVLDPFMGSGTVGVVAKRLNRQFIGVDLKKEYCTMAIKRLKNTAET